MSSSESGIRCRKSVMTITSNVLSSKGSVFPLKTLTLLPTAEITSSRLDSDRTTVCHAPPCLRNAELITGCPRLSSRQVLAWPVPTRSIISRNIKRSDSDFAKSLVSISGVIGVIIWFSHVMFARTKRAQLVRTLHECSCTRGTSGLAAKLDTTAGLKVCLARILHVARAICGLAGGNA